MQSGSCSTTAPPRSLLPGLGTYEPFVPEPRTVADGALAATRLGCDRPGGVLDCLRRLDTGALATAELMQRFSLVSYGNSVLPLEPRRALEAGRFHRVPVVQGFNQDEMRLFLAQTLAGYPIPDPAAYRARLERSFDPPTARAVEAAYPVSAFASPAVAWATVLTDASFACPTLRDGAALGRYVPVYAYRFGDRGAPDFTGLPVPPDLPFGATHGFELPYLFTIAPLTAPQRRLADRMTGYWTDFARTGVPAAPGAPRWPGGRTSTSVLSLAPGRAGSARWTRGWSTTARSGTRGGRGSPGLGDVQPRPRRGLEGHRARVPVDLVPPGGEHRGDAAGGVAPALAHFLVKVIRASPTVRTLRTRTSLITTESTYPSSASCLWW